MRKLQKQQAEEFVLLLSEAHDEINKVMELREYAVALELLEQCQEGAIKLGELIEATEGEGFATIPLLEHYCELVYQIHEEIMQNQLRNIDECYTILREALDSIDASVKNDIKVRLEIVFLPYKASMWDSLESVWKAAHADETCDAYVIPIPYYDRNGDMSFGKFHYEGHKFPMGVPITHYEAYDFEKRRPDAIYIHNPYDEYNAVTSVDPRFYSYELKKYTDMLVYIPYYSTTGGMSESQRQCSAYYHADYIVSQAEKYRKFFADDIPDEKFLPLGSPKFDKVIHTCQNPPEPPKEWKEKMAGKKVYFYNTSIGGMLDNTEAFLKKMKYVFECFEKNPEACLLWRPHPLLESTLESMRAGYKPVYETLKNYFMERNLGIYDTTPDITNTIALCDAYIGDSGTSVTSLFGIAGKPVFILQNHIHTEPDADDWRGTTLTYLPFNWDKRWIVTGGNKLYYSKNNDYSYAYCCDLSEYTSGYYYSHVLSIGGKEYVCPMNAQDIIILRDNKIEKKIMLERKLEQGGAFLGAVNWRKYIFLIPREYPAIVRYDTETEKVQYFDKYVDMFTATVNGQRRVGGFCQQDKYLFLASPTDNRVLVVNVETGSEQILSTNAKDFSGCMMLISDGKDLWFLPHELGTIVRWNPFSGDMQGYKEYPEGIRCDYMLRGQQCELQPFSYATFAGEKVYLSPAWANMYVQLDKKTGMMSQWIPPFEAPEKAKNGYFSITGRSTFIWASGCAGEKESLLLSYLDRKLYEVNQETNKCRELPVTFNINDLIGNEPGFSEKSEWLQYACEENAFNTLGAFLRDDIVGNAFDKVKQTEVYAKIVANNDGTCGEKVHELICSKL